ncbi:hypothetical protein [Mycobacterium sp. ACS4331]|uniref:hypothetical protein n=1 Tax=Mycobacterium sp. ACS4331 TaxID=1834121 RepID=UPI0008020926|nr:hypothetical protein [Mycobacterium sp. ACS4331]OBF25694.1 hypothetical protein A5727_04000 [Mycobacterium sp. ACS4331]
MYPNPVQYQPYQAQPAYPGNPMYPAYPPAQPLPARPSGVTAITGAILSLLGGLGQVFTIFGALAALTLTSDSVVGQHLPDWYGAVMVLTLLVSIALCAGLLVGGGFLLVGRSWARIVVAAACGAAIVFGIVSQVVASAMYRNMGAGVAASRDASSVFGFVGLIFPIATAVLVLLPSTVAWCRARGV